MESNQTIFIVFVLMGCLMVISVWVANIVLYREWFGAWPWKDARPIQYVGSKLRLPWRKKKQASQIEDPAEDATAEPLVISDFGHGEDSSIRPVTAALIV